MIASLFSLLPQISPSSICKVIYLTSLGMTTCRAPVEVCGTSTKMVGAHMSIVLYHELGFHKALTLVLFYYMLLYL